MRQATTIVIAALLAACVTPTVTERPSGHVNYRQFRTVSYKVHDLPSTVYGSDHSYGAGVIDLFSTLLDKKLEAMGYKVTGENPELSIDIAVKAAYPGSGAKRFWIGFGAGRALFLFDATFTDGAGTRLGRFEGGRSHTGMETGHFVSRDEIQTFAATRAVNQIEEFLANGGTFPSKDKKRP